MNRPQALVRHADRPATSAPGSTESEPGPAARTGSALPGALRCGWSRGVVELKGFLRNRQAVVFTLALPVLLLALFGTIFGGQVEGTTVDYRQVFTVGIIASGIMSVSFSSLAISIAIERDDGTLRRLSTTPMPKSAYFLGKLLLVIATGVAEVAILLLLGVLLFGLDLPSEPGRWVTLVWVFLLGIVSCSLIGIAYSRLAPNGRSAAAVVQPPYLALQFISGVYFLYGSLPAVLQTIAALFPLKWMAQGLRSVFLPDAFATTEVAGGWEHGRTALVLGAWCIAGFLLCLATFRWTSDEEK